MENQNAFLGSWILTPYELTLYASEENLIGEADPIEATQQGFTLDFEDGQIKCGIMGKTLHKTLIDKIKKLGLEKIAVFTHPREEPSEIWVFEATKIAAAQIKQGKIKLQAHNTQGALKDFERAIKFQQSENGDTTELKEVITDVKILQWKKTAPHFLLDEDETEQFDTILESYKDIRGDISDYFNRFLRIEDNFSPYHYLMSAIVHENKGKFLKAMKVYLRLFEKYSSSMACFEKAYALLEIACQKNKELLIRKDGVRMTFENHLATLATIDQQSSQKKPTCFICFNVDEGDVGNWLEKDLIPDLNIAGIEPTSCVNDLHQGQSKLAFATWARNDDFVIIACTPALKEKCENEKTSGVAIQIGMIIQRRYDEDKVDTVFPIYVKGARKESLPAPDFFEDMSEVKISHELTESSKFNYFFNVLDLFAEMRKVSREDSSSMKELFLKEVKEVLRGEVVNLEEKVLEWKAKKEQTIKEKTLKVSVHGSRGETYRPTADPVPPAYEVITAPKRKKRKKLKVTDFHG